MRIAVTGAAGMLGQALVRTLEARHEVLALGRDRLDVTQPLEVERAVAEARPDWIVHAAAFTGVDAAEAQPEEAFRANAWGSRNVAAAARRQGCAVLYYSTDYVFDGRRRAPYREWDEPAPLNTYGASKLSGEREVRSLCPAHLVVRTSWLFGPGGDHFPGKILERAARGDRLRVIDDQIGCPTLTDDLAAASLELIEIDARGTYHVTNAGSCSWYELARAVLELAGSETAVEGVPSSEYPTPARRPAYSVLDQCCLLWSGVGPLRPWQEALEAFTRGRDV